MLVRIASVFFLGFLIFIVYAANRGMLPEVLSFYGKIPFGDKLGHFFLMGSFAFLATWVLRAKSFPVGKLRIPIGAAVVLVVVCLEEFSQAFIPARNFSLADLAADLLGIVAFGWLAVRLYPQTASVR